MGIILNINHHSFLRNIVAPVVAGLGATAASTIATDLVANFFFANQQKKFQNLIAQKLKI